MRRSLSIRSRALVAVVALTLAVPVLGSATRVEATPPSTDPASAAGYGARWAARQVSAAGFVPGPTNAPNVSATIETALALAEAGVDAQTFAAIMAWLQANATLAIDPDGVGDSAGNLGQLLVLAAAAGIDPASFGGQDLVGRLGATLGAFAPGLYGGGDPTYDGAFRQGLAIVGLTAVGAPVPAAALTWLEDQQCDATVPAASGGWQPYRADLAVPCIAPDTTTFEGPDTNSTALAVQALAAAGASGGLPAALDFLHAAQDGAGGFAFIPGGDVDPNSTALVVLAIVAGGEDPVAGRWITGGANPVSSLLGWQLGCAAAPADQGAFASPFSAGAPDALATRQSVWGAAGHPFAAIGRVTFAPAPVPCGPATSPSTLPAQNPEVVVSGSPTTTTPTPVVAVATAVTGTPRYAG